jgi:hypothetical protein
VEAARAGDAGRGFAVVAEEVRSLAIRSADAAKNTAELIEESVLNAEGGVILNLEVVKHLDEISRHTERVSQVMHEIAAGAEQQTNGIGEINAAMDRMGHITQQTATSSEESAAAATELTTQAQRMRDHIGQFVIDTGARPSRVTNRGPHTRPRAPALGGTRRLASTPRAAAPDPVQRPSPEEIIPFHDDADDATLQEF